MSIVTSASIVDAFFRRLKLDGCSTLKKYGNVPALATSTGQAGEVAFDDDYIYCCTAQDTWKRVAIATW